MMIDDRQHFVLAGVRQFGVDLVRVDETDAIDPAYLSDALDLAKLETQKLHERAIFAVTQFMAIAHRRLGYPQALPDVCLRDGTSDPVWVRVPAKRNEHVLAPRGREGLCESTCAGLCGWHARWRQASDRFRHLGWNCGPERADKSRLSGENA
jgi:hypothetical protein